MSEAERRAREDVAAQQVEAVKERRAGEEERMRRARDVPAGLDAAQLETPLDAGARRGRMRHRIRYLRHARELLLRDLGGFLYEVERTAAGHQSSSHRAILETKTGRLAALDSELRELEARLGETGPARTVVREPGIGGTCGVCGELHGSDAHFCSNCGSPLTEEATRRFDEAVDRTIAARGAPPPAEGEAAAAPAPTPARRRFGWPPRRRAKPDPVAPDGPAGEPAAAAEPATGDQQTQKLAAENGDRAADDAGADAPTLAERRS